MRTVLFFSVLLLTCGNAFSRSGASIANNPQDSLSIIAPNVFTPNGDGVNDTWSILVHGYGVLVTGLQTTIYDRWGKEVFTSTNIREVWAGHNKIGETCSDGAYFYVITYSIGFATDQKTLKGFIELLR